MENQFRKTKKPEKAAEIKVVDATVQQVSFEDNRPETVAQLKYQEMANEYTAAQPVIQKKNETGMPDTLKSGIENLSGHSMDDVKVHYNSPKPAQLQAHAYAQGTDIHLASGQEKHLPHEAWHVVQQKQGRVQPTMQLKGEQINDSSELEREADIMGGQALQMMQVGGTNALASSSIQNQGLQRKIVQRLKILVGNVPVHINEYHFINLLEFANMSKSKSTSDHTVVLRPFSDFNGLGVVAEKYRESGESFSYDGITWGWNGKNELHPEPDKHCVPLSKEQIMELIAIAKEGEIPKATRALKDKSGAQALKALARTLKSENESLGFGEPVFSPFKFSLSDAKKFLGYKPGGKTKKPGGFVFTKGGSIEHPHIHLFYESRDPDADGCFSVYDISLKSSSGNHLNGEKWEKPPNAKDRSDIEMLMAVLQTVMRAGSSATESKFEEEDAMSSEDDDLMEEIPLENRLTTFARMANVDSKLLSKKIDQDILEDCPNFALFVEYCGLEIAEIRSAARSSSSKAKKREQESITVAVEGLASPTYVFNPDEVESDGDCFFNTLIELDIKDDTAAELREELAAEEDTRDMLADGGEWVEAKLDMPIAGRLWDLTIHVVVLGLDYKPIIVDTYGAGETVVVMAHIYGGHFTPMRPGKSKV